MDNQKFRPVTITRQTNKRKTSNRKNFSDHNYNFFQKSKSTKSPNNSQNQPQLQNQNVTQQAFQSIFFNDQPPATLDCSKNYPFFYNKIKT